MWGILTNMVSTRRSSARLQEKQSASSSVPSSPTPSAASSTAAASPTTRRTRNATKASPPSTSRTTRRSTPPAKASPGSGAKRGRARKSAAQEPDTGSEDASATQSDTATDNGSAAEETPVSKQLFAEQAESTTASTAKDSESEPEVVEQEEAQVVAAVAEEPEAEPEVAVELAAIDEDVPEQEEEEEIVMMDSSDDEEDANQKEEDEEAEDDEDFDVAAFAQMAASSVNLSTASKTSSDNSGAASKGGIHLVPDTLDSGAASRTKFLEFEGTKLALGAKVVTATASAEEQKVLKQQLGKVEKANRQRTEAQNVSTAGRKWFDMATHEMDADARRDFALLKMRNYLDPKKFYKTSDHSKKMPKHFQFGTVIEGAHEFKSARLTKKERKQTFTEEIMADDSIRSYTKRVFLQVQNSRAGGQGKKKKQKRF